MTQSRVNVFLSYVSFYDILCHQLIKTNFVGLRSGLITAETKIKKKVYFVGLVFHFWEE